MNINFEYEAKGATSDGKNVSESGEFEFMKYLDEDDYIDDGILFSKALSSVMDHFYTFGFEKQGLDISEVTITIKNLKVNN